MFCLVKEGIVGIVIEMVGGGGIKDIKLDFVKQLQTGRENDYKVWIP